jgi:hypothetical protein
MIWAAAAKDRAFQRVPVYLLVSLRKHNVKAAPIAPAQLAANCVGEFPIE